MSLKEKLYKVIIAGAVGGSVIGIYGFVSNVNKAQSLFPEVSISYDLEAKVNDSSLRDEELVGMRGQFEQHKKNMLLYLALCVKSSLVGAVTYAKIKKRNEP